MKRVYGITVGAIVLLIAVGGVYFLTLRSHSTLDTSPVKANTISVSGLSLCPSDCIYPAPYATALINISSSSPVSSMGIYVNGTYDTQVLQSANTMTSYAYLWKGSVPNSLIPVIKGDTYVFKFVATFQDGSTATTTASTTVS